MTWQILEGDVRDRLADLDAASIQTCVTSPPYWGLRDYGTAAWEGGDSECDHLPLYARRGVEVQSSTLDGGKAHRSAQDGGSLACAECDRCGAKRIDSQLGLEPTPEEYVANLVAVFREVRRVLRDDGTVWLNLGDSYAGSWGNQGRKPERGTQRPINGEMLTLVHDDRYPDAGSNTGKTPPGLKPKDLCGIPWSVAKALQQPYYTGTIRDERDRIWLAAMIDAEGCMFIHRRKAGQHNGQGYYRKNDSFGSGLEVASTDRVIVERCMSIVGKGSISEQSPEDNPRRKQTIYRWNLRTNECRDVIREVYPYLTAKQHEARLVCGVPSSGEQARAAWEALKSIHQGGEHPDIDFHAPASMFERGWFLRSDVIWSKLFRTRCPRASPTARRARTNTSSC